MVNAYSQGKGCRLDDTPHHLPTRRNYTIMVGEDVHEDLIALDQRRTNRLTVPSQCGDVINSIVIVIFFNITNNLNYTTSRSSCPRVALYTISQDSTCIVPKYRAKGTRLSTHTQLTACNSIVPPMIHSYHRYLIPNTCSSAWCKESPHTSRPNTYFVLSCSRVNQHSPLRLVFNLQIPPTQYL